MNEEILAQQIAVRVIHDTQFWIAVVGLIGAIVGAGLTIVGNFPWKELSKWLCSLDFRTASFAF